MITNKEKIIVLIKKRGFIKTSDISNLFKSSRQYASKLISELVKEKKLIKIGSTISTFYTTKDYLSKNPKLIPNIYSKTLKNKSLEGHKVFDDIEHNFSLFYKIPENIKSIFEYAFSEIFNNAIDHSKSKKINFLVKLDKNILSFIINDYGIGVFRNIMQKRNLKSEIEAIQDFLK